MLERGVPQNHPGVGIAQSLHLVAFNMLPKELALSPSKAANLHC